MLGNYKSAIQRRAISFNAHTRVNHVYDCSLTVQDKVQLALTTLVCNKDEWLRLSRLSSGLPPGFSSTMAGYLHKPKPLRNSMTILEFHRMIQDFFHRDCSLGFVIPGIKTTSGLVNIRHTALRQFRGEMLPTLLHLLRGLDHYGFPLESLFCEMTHIAFIVAYREMGLNPDDVLIGSLREGTDVDGMAGSMNQVIVLKPSFEVFSFFDGTFEPIGRLSSIFENPKMPLTVVNFPIDFNWNPTFQIILDLGLDNCCCRAITRYVETLIVVNDPTSPIKLFSPPKPEYRASPPKSADSSIITDFSLGFSISEFTFSPLGVISPVTDPAFILDLNGPAFTHAVVRAVTPVVLDFVSDASISPQVKGITPDFPPPGFKSLDPMVPLQLYSLINTVKMEEMMQLEEGLIDRPVEFEEVHLQLLDAYKLVYAKYDMWLTRTKCYEGEYRDGILFLCSMENWFNYSMDYAMPM